MKVQDIVTGFLQSAKAVNLDSDEVRAMDAAIVEKKSYERVIGELNEEQKQMLFFLDQGKSCLRARRNELVDLIARVVYGDSSVTAEEKEQVVQYRLAEVVQALYWEIFWDEVKLTFPESVIAEALGVRKGWLLVSFSQADKVFSTLFSSLGFDCSACEDRDTCNLRRPQNPGA